MSLGKRISAWWNNLLCFMLGHTLTNVCTRCGKVVNLKGTKRKTLEQRINAYFAERKWLKLQTEEYKGSLKLKDGLKKYSINMKTNELRLVEYEAETELVRNKFGRKIWNKDGSAKTKITKRTAKYDPLLVYLDASNDENAIRKANNYMFGIKRGVKITFVTTPKMDASEPTIIML